MTRAARSEIDFVTEVVLCTVKLFAPLAVGFPLLHFSLFPITSERGALAAALLVSKLEVY